MKNAAFEAIAGEDHEGSHHADPNDGVLTGATEQEISAMDKWAKGLRVAWLATSAVIMVTAYLNFANSYNSIASNFLALYVLFFSCLMCCFEIPLKMISVVIVQNFGFMYNWMGRSIFLMFVAVMLFQLSVMGKVMFGVIVLLGLVQIYVNCRHPLFEKYMRTLHFHNKAVAAQTTHRQIV